MSYLNSKNKLINELIEARSNIISAVKSFPISKRETQLFNEWSLKDTLAHLSGWDELTVNAIRDFNAGIEPKWGLGVNEFNKVSVEKRKKNNWDSVFKEFQYLSNKNIEAYKSISENKFDSLIWKNKKYTPRKFLIIDINHYKKEHLPKIMKVISECE